MMKLEHSFVEFIPKDVEDGKLYISIRFRTAVHNCACGCGNKTVTPLSPTDWYLSFNGKSVSLYPSIGNWAFPCRSHYWVTENKIEWASKWSEEKIKSNRRISKQTKESYYGRNERLPAKPASSNNITKPWWKFQWLFKQKKQLNTKR